MPSGFVTPITIKEAIENIFNRSYLLPAIQRKFVWNSDRIEVLFDSIMRGYPISSFMFWEVKESKIKNEFKFYQFLTEYRQFFKEDNPDIDTKASNDFMAVIDGQQRLTSIYIGLKGSYAYKLSRKRWTDTEENIPTRHLYINLAAPLDEDNERQMEYDFRFLTKQEFIELSDDKNAIWYKVNNILTCEKADDIDKLIEDNGWLSKGFTKATIRRLHKAIFEEKLINYYLETTQEIDKVLDIFIRTNSGGQPLSFSDLLMSITTAHWQADARKEIPDVVNKVFAIGQAGFLISKDFVLKTCLVLLNDNIKFQVRNFDQSRVLVFEQNWDRIRKCITEVFTLLSNLGFNNENLRAKNAAIPIIYYVFHRGIENAINMPHRHEEDRRLIRKWLCLSLLKGVFGGQSDSVLTGIRNVIRESLLDTSNPMVFPLEGIKNAFKSNPTKNLSFDDEFADGLLTTQMENPETFVILSLLYSHFKFDNVQYHKDHLHPSSYFYNVKRESFSTEEEFNFYKDPTNWNSILNLQLLNGLLNQSKQETPLMKWVEDNHIDKVSQLIPDVSLDISNFRSFLIARKKLLVDQLRKMVA